VSNYAAAPACCLAGDDHYAARATAALVAATSPAAPAAGPDGWVRIARLSPQAPAMDMFMYPFGNPGRPSC